LVSYIYVQSFDLKYVCYDIKSLTFPIIYNADEFVMGKESTFADLDSKQKAALTREYNQGSHKSQALVSEQGGGGGTRKKKGKRERDPADLDAIDEDVEEESDVEDEVEDMKKLQEKFKKKGRKKAATKKAAPKGGAAKKPKSKKK
jgi:hypothetical protein